MKPEVFQDASTGRLVPATFTESVDERVISRQGHAFVPAPLPPGIEVEAITGRLYPQLDRAKTGLLRLEAAIDALPDPHILLSAMQTREVQASSKIEDTYASLQEIAMASIDPAHAKADSIEVRRNREAVTLGLESPLPLGRRLICEMHAALIVDPRKRPGQIRDLQVCIGGGGEFKNARFVPPPPPEVEACLRDWEYFHHPGALGAPARRRFPYFIELAMSHYQFETIHPFSDGNGRLGRAIVNIAPVKDNQVRYPICNLSEWVHEHRQEYYDGLYNVSTHGAWEPWIRFFLSALAEQAELDLARAGRIRALHHSYRQLAEGKRRSSLTMKLIDQLFKLPAVTVMVAKDVLGVEYAAAQRHVQFLVEKGVLKQAGEGNYNRMYVAMDIIRAIHGQGADDSTRPD